MNKESLKEYLGTLYNATYIPIIYVKNDEVLFSYPHQTLPLRRLLEYKKNIVDSSKTYHFISTDESLSLGFIKGLNKEEYIIIGPTSPISLSYENINHITPSYAINQESIETIIEFFERTPSFTLNQFLNIMSLINQTLHHQFINVLTEYQTSNNEQEHIVGKNHSDELIKRKENSMYHDTYYFEIEYYNYLEKGDLEGLKNLLSVVPAITEGNVANNTIRQAKNIFIASISLATRHAIKGGLDIETAYQLSDSYIQEVEKMSDASAITLMNATAIFDFTKRVANAKVPTGMSEEIFKCIQYISNHVNEHISVDNLANQLSMERSTLSKKFKRELGFNISTYIMKRKLEEAQNLLTYTDRTISEISEYLCFSTQSYFQTVFKERYGMTPKKYRLKMHS